MKILVDTDEVIQYGCFKAIVMSLCRKQRRITLNQIMEILGLSEFSVRTHIRQLEQCGKIKLYRNKDFVDGRGRYNKIVRVDVYDD